MIRTPQSGVFVDGNNVMGSRPDGWWRDRAGAARLSAFQIAPADQRLKTNSYSALPSSWTHFARMPDA